MTGSTQQVAYITSIGTATPAYQFNQMRIAEFMANALHLDESGQRRLRALYRSTRIQHRYSVLADYGQEVGSFTFYPNTPDLEPFPTVSQRMDLYREHAVPLAEKAIRDCLRQRQVPMESITHLITVSCTGMYAPGPDIELIERLGLRTSTHRLAINFMGCYGAFNGMKAAVALAQADPKAKVLMVCTELCTIHFQKKNEEDHLLANALFADGSSAILVEGACDEGVAALEVAQFACEVLPEGNEDMAWHISDFGFEMKLTSRVPDVLKKGIRTVMDRLTAAQGIQREDVGLYAIHPGGRRILEVIEEVLGICACDNAPAYDVLRDYGNMSSVTVLFVLRQLWERHRESDGRWIFTSAFGPGLTAETALLRVRGV
ncbi:type III polyketide synthase [Telluribacter sp. SYSU D00476]|uniref:type III polyketide synthase n=1 Tax=Telluribacter sp. SYSU D00476 TaxID=2811430 RepID=UPI001FF3EFF5|nr:type III polyketide synthase [Telluribacter sp. SYSU D00476]